MAIYTKKGDKGETKVFDKKTGKLAGISKKSCKIKAIGVIDELNSWLGILNSEMRDGKWEVSEKTKNKYIRNIRGIQSNLFVINSIIAGSNLRFPKIKIKKLEREIDEWEGSLPVLKNFIYYGGDRIASQIFYARALCRRSERSLVRLSKLNSAYSLQLTTYILPYINRLSDYLFMVARKINFDRKLKEEFWIGNKRG